MNAIMQDLTNRFVRFWIVFLTEDKVFNILNVLVDTHRTWSVSCCLLADQPYPSFRFSLTECQYFHILTTCYEPAVDWKKLCVNKILFNFVYSLNDMLLTAIVRNRATRGHSYKLFLPESTVDCRKRFVAVRVVRVRNSLPDNVVSADSLPLFVGRLRSVDLGGFIVGRS